MIREKHLLGDLRKEIEFLNEVLALKVEIKNQVDFFSRENGKKFSAAHMYLRVLGKLDAKLDEIFGERYT